jgi:transposase InsO family protein
MDMWGMDYIGPITPACNITGAKYVLIIMDYFSRFIFAWPLIEATMQSTMNVTLNHVVPITGWPRSIYSDNGSHFTGKDIQNMFTQFGVTHFSEAILHPSVVGLAERYV